MNGRVRQGVWASVVVAGLGLWPAMAVAQDEGKDDGKDQSRECFELKQSAACFAEGRRLYQNDDVDGAYKAYLQAWDLKRSYEVAANLGNVEIKLEKWGDAYVHMWWAKENAPVSAPPEVFEKLEDKKREALKYTSARFIKVAHEGEDIGGAEVTIDGTVVGKTPLSDPIALDPGSHEVAITATGYEPLTKKLETRIGTQETVTYELVEAAGPAPVDTVDEDMHEPILPLVIVGGVVGIGGIAAGAALLGISSSKGSERSDLVAGLPSPGACRIPADATIVETCANIDDLADQESTFSSAGIGVLVAGGVVTAGTAIYAIWAYAQWDPEKAPGADTGLRIVPYATATEQGVTIGGRF